MTIRGFIISTFLSYCSLALGQSLQNGKQAHLFTPVSPSISNVDFVNTLKTGEGLNILDYYYYYNGGGVAIGDVNNDGLADIYLTGNNTSANQLYLNTGSLSFRNVTDSAGVAGTADWSTGVTMADINADGYLDIYVSVISDTFGLTGTNQLFINNRDGTFTDKAKEYGLNIKGFTSQVAFFDYDHDGDLDCFILSQSIAATERFRPSSDRFKTHPVYKSRLLRNELSEGVKKFTDVSQLAGIYQSDLGFGLGVAVADMDNDGWEDIYVGNDFYEDDYYYLNNGDGTFTEKGKEIFNQFSMNSMGVDIADCNNDGQLDVLTVDMLPESEYNLKIYDVVREFYIYENTNIKQGYHRAFVKNSLQINNGDAQSFSEIANLSNVADTDWSWSSLFADFDNDGNKDILITAGIPKLLIDLDFVTYRNVNNPPEFDEDEKEEKEVFNQKLINMMSTAYSHPFLFKGNGKGGFKNMSEKWGGLQFNGSATNGAAYGDLDNDGDLDLVINRNSDTAIILKNTTTNNNFIQFDFKNSSSNTNGIGYKVQVHSNGKLQYQQLMLTRGFQSSMQPLLHFGIESSTKVDSAVIIFPNLKCTTLVNPKINTKHTIDNISVETAYNHNDYFPRPQNQFADITDSINIKWRHQENLILDYYTQPMLPQAKSAKGPKLAVGDINGDSLDDFYACGAAGQSGQFFIQNVNGSFNAINDSTFILDSLYEDVDAVIFDSDNDGDMDLYVVSGGNEYLVGDYYLQDRLYINEGNGTFRKNDTGMTPVYHDKSSVDVGDIDNDGDLDLVVGNYLNPSMYGQPQTSFVYVNTGNNKFVLRNNYFRNVGMVSDVLFTDVNNDNIKDIVMVGEWMPIKIFIVNQTGLTPYEIPNSTGLWQSLYADDVNNDGNMDLIVGNWGLNNSFTYKKTPPLKLYWGDFNNNTRSNHLLVYNRDGKEYCYLPKFIITRSLPKFNKKYIKWADFANATLDEAFGEWIDTLKPLTAQHLESIVCYGDGKGGFKLDSLPNTLQRAPINVINKVGQTGPYLFGGNMFYCTPQEGQYDAQPLALGKFKSSQINTLPQQNLSMLKGSVKDLKWITVKGYGKVLIVARNNMPLKFYKYLNH